MSTQHAQQKVDVNHVSSYGTCRIWKFLQCSSCGPLWYKENPLPGGDLKDHDERKIHTTDEGDGVATGWPL